MDNGEFTSAQFAAAAGADWRALGGDAHAWFGASSHAAAAALVRDVIDDRALDLDVRDRGLGVRLRPSRTALGPEDVTRARHVSAAARQHGLSADPHGLRVLRIVAVTAHPEQVAVFWGAVMGYDSAGPGVLRDPLRRRPELHVRSADEVTPLRSRMHVDVGLPASGGPLTDEQLAAGARVLRENEYFTTVADVDGNVADVVNGGPLVDDPATADWRAMFGGTTAYRCPDREALATFVERAAAAADRASLPLLIDVRDDLVVLDSGKDRWETLPGWTGLAAQLQQQAGELDLRPDLTAVRFTQLMVDALDPTAVQHWWRAVLGYTADSDAAYADTVDPRWRDPVLMFQPLEPDDPGRRAHDDRLRLEVVVSADDAEELLAAATRNGGRQDDRGALRDPEGNLLRVVVEN